MEPETLGSFVVAEYSGAPVEPETLGSFVVAVYSGAPVGSDMREVVRRVGRLQRLAVFESAARLGSFTAAAAELGMTQPAVTRQVRALEASVRTDLFRRTSNRSELTDDGRSLLLHLDHGFSEIEGALAGFGQRAEVFVLACHPGFAQQWLVPRLDQVHEALGGNGVGGKELRLWLFEREAELADGSFDAAIQVGNGNFPGVSAELLFAESVFPVAAPSLADRFGLTKVTPPRRLLEVPLLHMDDGDRPWMSWTHWFSSFGVGAARTPGGVLFNNYPVVLQQALAGRGIALGWRHLVDELLHDGVLVQVGAEVTSPAGYFFTRPTGKSSSATKALGVWLRARFQETEGRETGGRETRS